MDASIWSYGDVDIYVYKDTGPEVTPRVDYLDPVGSLETTYIHQAGKESPTRKINCWCVENYDSLEALANGQAHVLISDQGSLGTWVIMSIKGDRVQDIHRTLPVVQVQLELMEVT